MMGHSWIDMELIFRTRLIDSDPTEVSVDSSYTVTSLNEEVRADIELLVDGVVNAHSHGGAPNLFSMIWSAVRSVYPSAKLVRMDKPPEEPDQKIPRVH